MQLTNNCYTRKKPNNQGENKVLPFSQEKHTPFPIGPKDVKYEPNMKTEKPNPTIRKFKQHGLKTTNYIRVENWINRHKDIITH
jgi:hypothetical protein